MDDTLVSLGSAALTIPNATETAQVEATVAAVQIGSGNFILAIVLVNLAGLVAVVTISLLLMRHYEKTYQKRVTLFFPSLCYYRTIWLSCFLLNLSTLGLLRCLGPSHEFNIVIRANLSLQRYVFH